MGEGRESVRAHVCVHVCVPVFVHVHVCVCDCVSGRVNQGRLENGKTGRQSDIDRTTTRLERGTDSQQRGGRREMSATRHCQVDGRWQGSHLLPVTVTCQNGQACALTGELDAELVDRQTSG